MRLTCEREVPGGDLAVQASPLDSPHVGGGGGEKLSTVGASTVRGESLDLTQGLPPCHLECPSGTYDSCPLPVVFDKVCHTSSTSSPVVTFNCADFAFAWTVTASLRFHADVDTLGGGGASLLAAGARHAESRQQDGEESCPTQSSFAKAVCARCDIALAPNDIGTYTHLLVNFSIGVADCTSYGVPGAGVELLCTGSR